MVETVTSTPNAMVVHIKLLTNLPIFQKPSFQRLYIETSLLLKPLPQSKGAILVKVYQGDTNMCVSPK